MSRCRRAIGGLALAILLCATGTVQGFAQTAHGPGSTGGGGLSGGAGGGNNIPLTSPDCAVGSTLLVFNEGFWYSDAAPRPAGQGNWSHTNNPTGDVIGAFVYPGYDPNPASFPSVQAYRNAMGKMAVVIDGTASGWGGWAVGPPVLLHYHPVPGVGYPPGFSAPFDPNATSIDNTAASAFNSSFPGSPFGGAGYFPSWRCYIGSPGSASFQPFDTSGTPPRNPGTTTTNSLHSMLVQDTVVSQQLNDCHLQSINPGPDTPGVGVPPPPSPNVPPWPFPPVVNTTYPGCPESQFDIGHNPAWHWYIYESPVLQVQPAALCDSGMGPFLWDWEPATFTARSDHCTPLQVDTATLYRVHNSDVAAPLSAAQRQLPAAGVTVSLEVLWRDWCWGVAYNDFTGEQYTFRGSYDTQVVYPDGVANPLPTDHVDLDCDGAAFEQNYAPTAPVAVKQIESVVLGVTTP